MKNKAFLIFAITILVIFSTGCDNTKKQTDIVNYSKNEIKIINNFYNVDITKTYKKVNELAYNYSVEQAKKDKCLVINNEGIYNQELLNEFINKYENKQDAFIRTITPTIEGDALIYDIKYSSNENKIYILIDYKRDTFASSNKIQIKTYENISKYDDRYYVAYNGELTESSLNTEDAFIISPLSSMYED